MKIYPYDPTKHGTARWLGDGVQMIVMEYLWEQYGAVTVRRIYRHFAPRWRYTTIATTLDRQLVASGLVSVAKRGVIRWYTPRYSREVWEAAQLAAIKASIERDSAVAVGDNGWGHEGWE